MKKRLFNFIYPKKEHKMKKYIPAFILVVIVTSLMTFIVYDATVVYERYQIPMKIRVRPAHIPGINTDTDSINFGGVPVGAIGERIINITNGDDNPHLIRIRSRGYISDWIKVTDNGFVLNPHTVKEVRVRAHVPSDALLGNYTGTLEVVFENIVG